MRGDLRAIVGRRGYGVDSAVSQRPPNAKQSLAAFTFASHRTSNVSTRSRFLLPGAETGLDCDSKAQAEQVRSIAVERVGERLGVVPNANMLEIDEALPLHLGL